MLPVAQDEVDRKTNFMAGVRLGETGFPASLHPWDSHTRMNKCAEPLSRLFFLSVALVAAHLRVMEMPLKIQRLRALSVALIAAAANGCTLETDVSGPGGLIKYSGDMQTVTTNTTLPTPLTVLVVNQFGERLKNVTVNWTIESGGGTLSAPSSITDETGLASVDYTSGPTAGEAVIRAQVHGVPALRFHITIS